MKDYFIIAFYKAKLGDGKWIDDGISLYTTFINGVSLLCLLRFKMAWKVIKNRYSHVEAWWFENKHYEMHLDYGEDFRDGSETIYLGEMFTSTMRDDTKGTVIRDANGVLTNPWRWDIMIVHRESAQIKKAKNWARWQESHNLGYNKGTIANFFNPLRPTQKPKENEPHICSVAIQGFCWMADMFRKWRIWSPIKLWWKLTRLGEKTEPLVKE